MNNDKRLKRIFGACLAGFIVILAIIFAGAVSNKSEKTKKDGPKETTAAEVKEQQTKTRAILKKIDKEEQTMGFWDIDNNKELLLDYTGGTNFTSRYGQVISSENIVLGEIVTISYGTDTNKLQECSVSDKAWEYTSVDNWKIDKTGQQILIGSAKYQFNNTFFVFTSGQELDLNAVSNQDQMTFKGVDGQAYSAIVTKGHGYLQITGADAFVGGSLEVGTNYVDNVEKEVNMTLREGDYKITLKKGSLEATKQVHIAKDEKSVISFSEYEAQAEKTGKVTFKVSPAGADLFIDGKETDYDDPVELKYGTYQIKVTLAGYQTYTAKLKVASSEETLYITLVDESKVKATPTPDPDVVVDDTDPSETATPTPAPAGTEVPQATATPEASPTVTASQIEVDTAHKINVTAPSGAMVYVEGVYKGTVPCSFSKVIGTNMKVTLKYAGYDDKTYTMTVANDAQDMTWSFNKWWE